MCKHCISYGDCSSYSRSLTLSGSAGIGISVALAAQRLTQAAEPAWEAKELPCIQSLLKGSARPV